MRLRRLDGRFAPLLLRLDLALVLFVAAAAIYVSRAVYRTLEAVAVSHTVAWLYSGSTYVNPRHSTFYVGLGHPDAFAFRITPQCSSALLVVGLLLITAATALLPRASFRRLLLAVVAGGAVFFATNVVRLVAIVWSTRIWGLDTGFRLSHTYIGSWVTIAGGVVAVSFYLGVLGVTPRRLLLLRPRR